MPGKLVKGGNPPPPLPLDESITSKIDQLDGNMSLIAQYAIQNEISNIVQLDGADTLLNDCSTTDTNLSDNSQDVTNYSTDDEQNHDH